MSRSLLLLASLLVVSFGFSSAFADSAINSDDLGFDQVNPAFLPQHAPVISDPLTGDEPSIDYSKQYALYPSEFGLNVNSDEKQLINIDEQEFYLVPTTLDKTANIAAILLLAIPFGILVYRMSDSH